nr:LamG domain-containing protein [Desulfuromonadales bacterium]
GLNINTQPDVTAVRTEIGNLIDRLIPCSGTECDNRVEKVMKGACASVLGSAAMLIQ